MKGTESYQRPEPPGRRIRSAWTGFFTRHAPGLIKNSLYIGLMYVTLFAGVGECRGQECTYYRTGICGGASGCEDHVFTCFTSDPTCASCWDEYQEFCWGHIGCSTQGLSACACYPGTEHTITIDEAHVSCAATGPGGWCRGGATLNLSATDSPDNHPVTFTGSIGINSFNCGNPCSQSLPEGSGAISYEAECSAGLSVGPFDLSWQLDLTPPIVWSWLSDGIPSITNTDWYTNGPVTFHCDADDAPSGVYSITGGLQTVTGDGIYPLSCTAEDYGGNTASASATVRIDSVTPNVSLLCNGSPCGAGWYTGNVTLTAGAADSTSGVAPGTALVSLDGGNTWIASTTLADGVFAAQARVFDVAGNSATASGTIQVDATAPSTAWGIANGSWVRGEVFLSGTSADATSGVGVVYLSFNSGATWSPIATSSPWSSSWNTAGLGDGPHPIRARTVDSAGNTGPWSEIVINVDNTAPVITLPNPLMGYDPGRTQFISSDPLPGSGLDSARVTFSGNGIAPRVILYPTLTGNETIRWDGLDRDGRIAPPGTYDVLIEIWDNVGNHSSTTGQWVRVAIPTETEAPTRAPTDTRMPDPPATDTRPPENIPATETGTSVPAFTRTPPAPTGTPVPQIDLPGPLRGLPFWAVTLPVIGMGVWFAGSGAAFASDGRWKELRELRRSMASYREQSRTNFEGGDHDD